MVNNDKKQDCAVEKLVIFMIRLMHKGENMNDKGVVSRDKSKKQKRRNDVGRHAD